MPDTSKSRPPVHARPKYYDQGMEAPRSVWVPYELGGISPCFDGTTNLGDFLIQFEMVSSWQGRIWVQCH